MTVPYSFASLVVISTLLIGCGPEERDPPPGDTALADLALLRPAEDLKIAPGYPVAIEWAFTTGNRAATVDIIADGDGDPSTTSDQLPLSLGNVPSESPTVFAWHTADVPIGTYHLFARSGEQVSVAAGVVEIVEPLLAVENLANGEQLHYPLALLSGTMPTDVDEVSAGLLDEPRIAWPLRAEDSRRWSVSHRA